MPTPEPLTAPSPSTSAAVRLTAVDASRIQDALQHPRIQELLSEMVARYDGDFSMYGIAQQFMSQEWIMWLVWDGEVRAVLATEIYRTIAGQKRCRIPFCTGRQAKRWVSLLVEIEDWARSVGCARVDMIARPGWGNELPEYRKTHILLEKAL